MNINAINIKDFNNNFSEVIQFIKSNNNNNIQNIYTIFVNQGPYKIDEPISNINIIGDNFTKIELNELNNCTIKKLTITNEKSITLNDVFIKKCNIQTKECKINNSQINHSKLNVQTITNLGFIKMNDCSIKIFNEDNNNKCTSYFNLGFILNSYLEITNNTIIINDNFLIKKNLIKLFDFSQIDDLNNQLIFEYNKIYINNVNINHYLFNCQIRNCLLFIKNCKDDILFNKSFENSIATIECADNVQIFNHSITNNNIYISGQNLNNIFNESHIIANNVIRVYNYNNDNNNNENNNEIKLNNLFINNLIVLNDHVIQ